MASKTPDNNNHRYGIGAVARMTGLTDHTIRVWERRYAAVVADRAKNGRREYSEVDVEKLMLLKRLTDDGIAISKIATQTVDELRERAQSMRQMAGSPDPSSVRTAILGDLVPVQLSENAFRIAPVDIVIADSNRERFRSDLRNRQVDLLAIEVPVLDQESIEDLREMQKLCSASAGILIYRFAKSKDIERAEDLGIHVLRAPANVDALRAVLVRAARDGALKSRKPIAGTADEPGFPEDGEIPPRLFSATQLARLTRISTTIDCECPQHLAALVNDLSAFEIYSANCEDRSEEDRALHHYLHVVTAKARAQFEQALHRVVLEEGLEV